MLNYLRKWASACLLHQQRNKYIVFVYGDGKQLCQTCTWSSGYSAVEHASYDIYKYYRANTDFKVHHRIAHIHLTKTGIIYPIVYIKKPFKLL